MDAAEKIVGQKTLREIASYCSEDFADMLRYVKGAYCFISHSGKAPLHSPHFTRYEHTSNWCVSFSQSG